MRRGATKTMFSLSRTSAFGLALVASLNFGAGGVLAQAMSPQASSESSNTARNFAGTWHWMFEREPFATMVLTWDGSSLSGSVTGSHIALNDDGTLMRADSDEDSTPKAITKATLEGSALHVTAADGFQFTMTLKDDNHADIHPGGAPANMKPIPAEKVP